jgi:hypothetical protein
LTVQERIVAEMFEAADKPSIAGMWIRRELLRWAAELAAPEESAPSALELAERLHDYIDRSSIYGPADALRNTADRLVRVLRS